jgi:hypothetical protein
MRSLAACEHLEPGVSVTTAVASTRPRAYLPHPRAARTREHGSGEVGARNARHPGDQPRGISSSGESGSRTHGTLTGTPDLLPQLAGARAFGPARLRSSPKACSRAPERFGQGPDDVMARRALRAPGEDTALSCTRTAGGSSIRVEVGPLSEPGGSGDDVSEPASPRRLGNRRCASGPRGGRGLRQPRGIRIGPDEPRAQVRTGMRTRERQCNNAMQLTMGRLTVAPTLRRARGLFRTSGAAAEHLREPASSQRPKASAVNKRKHQ